MDSELTQGEVADIVLNEYAEILRKDILKLKQQTGNGSMKKAYLKVLLLISEHKAKWEYQKQNNNANT